MQLLQREIEKENERHKSVSHFELGFILQIRVITKLQNSEQSYKGKDKHINRQNQSTTGKL